MKSAIILVLLISSCAGTFGGPSNTETLHRRPHVFSEDGVVLWAAWAVTAADTTTTLIVSNGGTWTGRARELDPLLGYTPNAGVLVLCLAAGMALEYGLFRVHPLMPLIAVGVEGAAVANNVMVIGEHGAEPK